MGIKEEVTQQKATLLQDVKEKFQHEIQILNAHIRRLNCLTGFFILASIK